MSIAEYKEYLDSLKKPGHRGREHKFGAVRTSVDGRSFPSKLEASVFSILQIMERDCHISQLKQYDTVFLTEAKISWKLDFCCFAPMKGGPEKEWHEAKGVENSDYLIKLKLWRYYGPGKLHVWKGSHEKPYIHETVIPRGWHD